MEAAVGETFKEITGRDGMLALIHGLQMGTETAIQGRWGNAMLGTTPYDTNGLTWIQPGKDRAAVLFLTSIWFHPFTCQFRAVRSN